MDELGEHPRQLGAQGLPCEHGGDELPREPDIDPTVYLLLSLFLMLLAFFVILGASSRVEKRMAKPVMQSLSSAFATPLPSLPALANIGLAVDQLVAKQTFQDEISAVFTATTPAEGRKISLADDLIEVVLPVDRFFATSRTEMRPELPALLDRWAAAMKQPQAGLKTYADIILAGAWPRELPVEQGMEAARGGVLVREMVARGVPESSLAIGLERGKPGTVRLLFRIRAEDEPRAAATGR